MVLDGIIMLMWVCVWVGYNSVVGEEWDEKEGREEVLCCCECKVWRFSWSSALVFHFFCFWRVFGISLTSCLFVLFLCWSSMLGLFSTSTTTSKQPPFQTQQQTKTKEPTVSPVTFYSKKKKTNKQRRKRRLTVLHRQRRRVSKRDPFIHSSTTPFPPEAKSWKKPDKGSKTRGKYPKKGERERKKRKRQGEKTSLTAAWRKKAKRKWAVFD